TVSVLLVHIAVLAAAIPFIPLAQGQVFRQVQLALFAADHPWRLLRRRSAALLRLGSFPLAPEDKGDIRQHQDNEKFDQTHARDDSMWGCAGVVYPTLAMCQTRPWCYCSGKGGARRNSEGSAPWEGSPHAGSAWGGWIISRTGRRSCGSRWS